MTSRPRRIAVVTGSRAEFGLLEPLLRSLHAERNVRPQLIVTGMHLLPAFGSTIRDIRRAGWHIDATVRLQSGKDDAVAEAQAVGRGIERLARTFASLRSDVVVVLGDRIEAFAAASAAALSRICLAHIHGGDRATGQTDDALRNAITRLAHVHFTASQDATKRLLRMGEAAWRIHRVGAPGLDDIAPTLIRVRRQKARSARPPYAVVVQHPGSSDDRREERVMHAILNGVEKCGLDGVVVYPNSDPGHRGVIRAIRSRAVSPRWETHRSLPREAYLTIASQAAVLIGNSSSAIIESASLGVCAVNVGDRQAGRLRCGRSVIDAADDASSILRALRFALRQPRPRGNRSVYGEGNAGRRIGRILARMPSDERILRKELTY